MASIALGAIYLDLGDFGAAQQQLAEALSLSHQWSINSGIHNATALLALVHVRQQRGATAEALLRITFGEPSLPEQPCELALLTLKQRLYWYVRAELLLQHGDASAADGIVTTLIAATEHDRHSDLEIVPKLLFLQGLAQAALQQHAAASATLHRAHHAATEQSARPLLWRIEVALGNLSGSQGERTAAEAHYATARSLIETLAATLLDGVQRQSFLHFALSHLPAPQPITPLRMAKAAFDGLTERETRGRRASPKASLTVKSPGSLC